VDRHAAQSTGGFAGARTFGLSDLGSGAGNLAVGLVEIAAHTDASHKGILANPQGNMQPAAAT
jgi:hypothetical protein